MYTRCHIIIKTTQHYLCLTTYTLLCIYVSIQDVEIMGLALPKTIILLACCFGSVVKSCLTVCDPTDCSTPGFPVLHYLLEFLQTHSCPLSQQCHPTISSSVASFSSCLQSFPASRSFPVCCLFTSDVQCWSFIISPSNEYLRLIFSRIE